MYLLAKLILKLALLRMQMLKQRTALLVYLQRVVVLICWAPQKSHLSPNINSFKQREASPNICLMALDMFHSPLKLARPSPCGKKSRARGLYFFEK